MFNYGGVFVGIYQVLGCLFLCTYFNIWTLTFIPIIIICGFYITKLYFKAGQHLQRLVGVYNSPLLNIIDESILGASTIRAYQYQNQLVSKFNSRLDNLMKINIFSTGANNWFGLFLNFVAFLFLCFLVLFSLIFQKAFTPEAIGFVLTYVYSFQIDFFHFLDQIVKFSNKTAHMERCLEYTKIIEEKGILNDTSDNFENWPKIGKIEIFNLVIKYRPDTEVVIKNMNLKINNGEKIGIVGRTGSGKSTLFLTFLRIIEATEGSIFIDDVDINKIDLHLLRKKITIIPQDPKLFEGTLRYNIDPLGKYSDEEIFGILNQTSLSDIIKKQSLDM
jgi:ATP-binding cassette subfamily C (CFTR/MRP) protein 1